MGPCASARGEDIERGRRDAHFEARTDVRNGRQVSVIHQQNARRVAIGCGVCNPMKWLCKVISGCDFTRLVALISFGYVGVAVGLGS